MSITAKDYVNAYCPSEVLRTMPFMLEFGLWRGWHQTLIYTPEIEKGEYLLANNVDFLSFKLRSGMFMYYVCKK